MKFKQKRMEKYNSREEADAFRDFAREWGTVKYHVYKTFSTDISPIDPSLVYFIEAIKKERLNAFIDGMECGFYGTEVYE